MSVSPICIAISVIFSVDDDDVDEDNEATSFFPYYNHKGHRFCNQRTGVPPSALNQMGGNPAAKIGGK